MANVVEKRYFSCANVGHNNNKRWNITLYDNDDVEAEYSGQGNKLATKLWTGKGRTYFDKKIAEKLRGKLKLNKETGDKERVCYYENKVAEGVSSMPSPTKTVNRGQLNVIAHKQIIYTSDTVRDLVEFLIQENIHNITGATDGMITYDTTLASFRTTQGVVVPEQVARARALLDDMAEQIINDDWDFEQLLNEYLSLIPRKIKRVHGKLPTPDMMLPNTKSLQAENDLLDGLEVSFNDIQSGAIVKSQKKKTTPKLFDVTLNVVRDRTLLKKIESYYERTKKTMHTSYRYKLHKAYKIDIKSVTNNFANIGKSIGNIQELFHGTKCSNLLAIFKKGLIIPPSRSGHVTGRLYGDGVYASDISSKALNYATNFWGSGGSTNRIFMLLCDFAMGNIYYTNDKYGVRYPVKGYDSTFAKAGRGGVYNNEMIVYNAGQVNLKYLLEFK